MAEKVEVLQLDINTQALIAKLAQTKAEIDKLKTAQKQLTADNKSTSDSFVKNEVELKRLGTAYTQQKNLVSQLTTANNSFANATEAIASAIAKENNTVEELRNNNTQLLALRNQVNLSTAEGVTALNALNAKLDENNAKIKESVSAYEQQKISIGDYSNQIQDALSNINPLNGGISGFIERSKEAGGAGNLLTTSAKGMTTGLAGVTKASLAFIATPIGAVLALLVGAFALIKNAMNRSEEATNKLRVSFATVTGIINTVLKALEPLGKYLIDGIVMGFELAGAVAEKTMGLLADGLAFLGFDKASESVKGFTNEIKAGVKDAQDLAKAEIELEEAQRKSRITQLEYQKDAEKLRQIRDDENKTIAERIKANDELGVVLKNQLKDELAIAQTALNVANLRIKAEGSTKATLDAQAEALTQIADIQERITGQESEQLVNRTSLQKEANDKAKELRQKALDDAIQKSKDEIELYIQSQGIKKKALEDELKFEEELSKKRLAVLKKEFDAGKISKTAYEAEKLRITNEFALKQVDATVQNAQRELDIYKANLEQRKADDTFFTQEKLQAKLDESNELAIKESEFQALRLEQGIINEQQYQDAITAVKEAQRIRDEEAQKIRDEAKKEQEVIDLENQRILDEEKFTNDFDLELERERIKYEQEIKNAEKTGADTSLIEQKYALVQTKIFEAKESAKRQQASQTFGDVAKLLGEQTAAGKAAGIAQATMNTYEGITQVWASDSALPEPYATIAKVISTGVVLASGLGAVKKITSTKVPSYADGGQVPSLGSGVIDNGANLSVPLSNGDDTLAYVKQGEVILNSEQQRRAGGVNFFKSIGVPSFAGGGFVGGNTNLGTQGGVKLDTIEMANLMAQANANLPAPVVSVQEINSVDNRVKVYESYANF
ncbi:MAG TPA: hypothetical protein PLL09_04650 [Flavobacterium sp.]|uniref:hypothetical protein n=1 Tax=unclassified Flavobacterium TaxID=196869 RepID=UPI0025C05EDA|nr:MULTISPECIES: hypothetical protein [unclassified Flavobacterium]HRE77098.1 hypothetical protein [Flavobacterium sp.]